MRILKSLLTDAFRFCVPPRVNAYKSASWICLLQAVCVPRFCKEWLVRVQNKNACHCQHHGNNTGTGAKSPLTTHWPLELACHPDRRLFQNPKIPMHGSGCTTLGLTQELRGNLVVFNGMPFLDAFRNFWLMHPDVDDQHHIGKLRNTIMDRAIQATH